MEIENPSKQNDILIDQLSSMKELLIQAIRNRDKQLFQYQLRNQNIKIINTTLSQFTEEQYFENFIQFSTDILESYPESYKYVLLWLISFLQIKKDFIKENPSIIHYLNEKSDLILQKVILKDKYLRVQMKNQETINQLNRRIRNQSDFSFGKPMVHIDVRKQQIYSYFYEEFQRQQQLQEDDSDIEQQIDLDEKEEELLYQEEDYQGIYEEKMRLAAEDDSEIVEEDQSNQIEEEDSDEQQQLNSIFINRQNEK